MRKAGTLAAATALSIVLALLVPAAATTQSMKSATPAPAGFFGVDGIYSTERDYETMADADVGVYRAVFPFGVFKRKPNADYDWSFADSIVEQTAENGIDLIPILYGSPPWISEDLNAAPLEGEAREQWNDFLISFARRYGRDGDYWRDHPGVRYQPVETYQIWNEPNSITWWGPRPNPKEYATLLHRSAIAIDGVDPGARILTAGIVARPTNNHAIDGAPYLRELFSLRRAAVAADALGYHPYASTVGGVRRQLAEAREALGRSLAPGLPIWITEIGWGSKGRPSHPLIKSEQGQVQVLEDTFRMILANREFLGVERTLWYLWRERPDSLCRWCRSSGLLHRDSDPKPLLDAFRRIATR